MTLTTKIDHKTTHSGEERYRSLIEASLDPLLTVGPDSCITDLNEAFIRATGLNRNESLGSKFSQHFVEQEKAAELFADVLATGSVANFPLTLLHRSGTHT